MLLFKRILNFSKTSAAIDDKRKLPRYPVGQPFPFKTIITLIGHDDEGKPLAHDKKSQDWAGRLSNLSSTGGSIQLHSAAAGMREENCIFKLRLDEYRLDIPATVAHFRVYQHYTLCGFAFRFPNFETEKAYWQVLEPVAIGASLEAVEDRKIKQDVKGLTKESYEGLPGCRLHVWRPTGSSQIYSFDYQMNDYGVRWSEGMGEVEPYGINKEVTSRKTAAPFLHLTASQLEEVRWLFCLSVPNIAKAVPADVRRFLAALVAT